MRKLILTLTLLFFFFPQLSYANCPAVCNCIGDDSYGGVCYDGYGGPAYDGYGGPAYDGYGGACYAGYGGPCYKGYGGPCYEGYGGGKECPAICSQCKNQYDKS